jgi:hypothetical protein
VNSGPEDYAVRPRVILYVESGTLSTDREYAPNPSAAGADVSRAHGNGGCSCIPEATSDAKGIGQLIGSQPPKVPSTCNIYDAGTLSRGNNNRLLRRPRSRKRSRKRGTQGSRC